MIRPKGFVWLASHMHSVRELDIAGTLLRHQDEGCWWANIPQGHCLQHLEWHKMLEEIWTDPFGDRRQGIVFIDTGINKSAIRQQMDSCLLKDMEIKSG